MKTKTWLYLLIVIIAALAPIIARGEQEEVLMGTFHIIWKDPVGKKGTHGVLYKLIDSRGERHTLLPAADLASRLLAFNTKRVVVYGAREGVQRFRAHRVLALQAAEEQGLTGSLPIVSIICTLPDGSSMPPPQYYEELTGDVYPGVNHFWNEVSRNNVNFTGSVVKGPYVLPHTTPVYVYDVDGDGEDDVDLKRLIEDCTSVADPDVRFTDFFGIRMFFNSELDGFGYGGSWMLQRDGSSKVYGAAWLPLPSSQYLTAHETGHMLGLPHSVGPRGEYDSRWDVMSKGYGYPSDPSELELFKFGPIGVHTIAHHKDRLGWIPPAQKYIPKAGSVETIRLEHLASMASSGYLMVEVPVRSTLSYTAEVRRRVGYDVWIPGEGVLIHRINGDTSVSISEGRPEAEVVDADGSGNPNDEGAIWRVGESLILENGVMVSVDAADATGFFVTIDASSVLHTVRVFSPEEGERWKVGTARTIAWQGGNGGNVKIDISRDGGTSWEVISPDTPNDGDYRWRVSGFPTSRAVIRVSSGLDAGMSEQFAVIKKRKAR